MLSVNEDRTQPRSCQSLPVFHDSRNENDRKDTCYIERYGEGIWLHNGICAAYRCQ